MGGFEGQSASTNSSWSAAPSMSRLATSTITGCPRSLAELAPYVAIPPVGTAVTLGSRHAMRVARAMPARAAARQSLVEGGSEASAAAAALLSSAQL